MAYDPSIQAHIAKAEERWGIPSDNLKRLVTYGIPALDAHLYGINTDDGELILVVGEEKMRKTTLVINVLINIMTAEKPEEKPFTVIDTLESGMPPYRYFDQLVSNLASRILVETGHVPISLGRCPICSGSCKELRLSPEFLKYETRSPQQRTAIEEAIERMNSWPMDIWGPGIKEGNTRDLKSALQIDEARWVKEVEEKNAKIFVTDHVQQYLLDKVDKASAIDYEKLVRSVSVMGSFVAMHKAVVFMISQISLTSLREAKSGGKQRASGGKKPHEEANVILSTSYEKNSGQLGISLEDSRRSGTGFWKFPIDDISGALLLESPGVGF